MSNAAWYEDKRARLEDVLPTRDREEELALQHVEGLVVPVVDMFRQEHDNFRAALRSYTERREAELGLRLAAALWPLWYVRGYSEGRGYLTELLALPADAGVASPRAASLVGAAQLALWQGDDEAARTYAEESIATYRTLGDTRGLTNALIVVGFVARIREEYETARTLLEEALALAIDHTFIAAASLHQLGMMEVDARGDHSAARGLFEESLAIYRALGLGRFIGLVCFSLGDVVRAQGDHIGARRLVHEGLTILSGVGERLAIPSTLDSCAHLAFDEGEVKSAARLSGAATRLRESSHTSVWPAVQRTRQLWLTAALGDEEFPTAWAEGQAMTDEQAIGYALGKTAEPNMVSRHPVGSPKRSPR